MSLPQTFLNQRVRKLIFPLSITTSLITAVLLGKFMLDYNYSLTLAAKGNRELKNGDYKNSMNDYQKAAEESLMNRKDNLSWYQFAQRLYSAEINFAKGKQYFLQNKFDQAIIYLEKVDVISPKYNQALGYILKAEIELNLLFISNTHYQNGVSFFNQGQWSQAVTELSQVINLDSNYQDAQNKISQANKNLQQVSPQSVYPTLASITMSSSVGSSGQPLSSANRFPANSSSLYAVLSLNNSTTSTVISYTRYLSGQYVDSGQASPTLSKSPQYFYFSWIKNGSSYPTGNYTLRFYLNGYYTGTTTYYIY